MRTDAGRRCAKGKSVGRCNTERSASFRAPRMSTEGFVWIGEGLPQGDPASPILFVAVLEQELKPLVESWQTRGFGVPVGCTRLTVLAFAGDVYVFGSTLEQTRTMMGELSRYLEANGFSPAHSTAHQLQLGHDYGRLTSRRHGHRGPPDASSLRNDSPGNASRTAQDEPDCGATPSAQVLGVSLHDSAIVTTLEVSRPREDIAADVS